jgi:hypothetical protein
MEAMKAKHVRRVVGIIVLLVIGAAVALGFLGVQPLSTYKDTIVSKVTQLWEHSGTTPTQPSSFPSGVYYEQGSIVGEGIVFYADGTFKSALVWYAPGTEAGTYSAEGGFITFTNELTGEKLTVRYVYSKASQWLYLYLPNPTSEYPSTDCVVFVRES